MSETRRNPQKISTGLFEERIRVGKGNATPAISSLNYLYYQSTATKTPRTDFSIFLYFINHSTRSSLHQETFPVHPWSSDHWVGPSAVV